MIYLASSSPTRALLLKNHGIEFEQICTKFDESGIDFSDPYTYAYKVANAKKEQFFKIYKNIDRVLFADSAVVVDNQIFGKASSDDEACAMLKAQSDNFSSVVTAMIFVSKKMNFVNSAITTYKFAKFSDDDLREYIAKKDYVGKAGAMTIEGFNKKYIISQSGLTSTAMGLSVEILKRYLW